MNCLILVLICLRSIVEPVTYALLYMSKAITKRQASRRYLGPLLERGVRRTRIDYALRLNQSLKRREISLRGRVLTSGHTTFELDKLKSALSDSAEGTASWPAVQPQVECSDRNWLGFGWLNKRCGLTEQGCRLKQQKDRYCFSLASRRRD